MSVIKQAHPSRAAPAAQGKLPTEVLATPSSRQSGGIARPDLRGHLAIAANTCFYCGGPLKDETGTFSERMYRGREGTFAAAICNECKRGTR